MWPKKEYLKSQDSQSEKVGPGTGYKNRVPTFLKPFFAGP
jgi:hypothetical protein